MGLTIVSLIHIFTHRKYKIGNRVIWVIVSFISIIGPVIYFIIGKDE
ncbi:PLDc N-terminal domain-containing protein [Clostridium sp.]